MSLGKWHIIFCIIACILCSASAVSSKNSIAWIEGFVTKAPWIVDDVQMVEVDWKPYKILKGLRVTHRYWRSHDAYDEKIDSVNSIFTAQRLLIQVRGKLIVQIVIL